MTKYKCGHNMDELKVLDDMKISMFDYWTWTKSVGSLGTKTTCWKCWNERLEEKNE